MNKFVLCLFLATNVLFFSCENDDSDEPDTGEINESAIVGDWELTDFYSEDVKITATPSAVPVPVDIDVNLKGKDYETTATFAENPNTVVSTAGYNVEATIEVPVGDPIVQEIPIAQFNLIGEWNIDGNQLTISDPVTDATQKATIITLTETTLTYKMDISELSEITDNLDLELEGFDSIELNDSGELFFTLTKKQ